MQPGLPISTVSHRLGIASSTLRSWQRRYGLGASTFSPGGHRRYTVDDLRRLHLARELMAQGVTAAEAARSVLATPAADLPPWPGPPEKPIVGDDRPGLPTERDDAANRPDRSGRTDQAELAELQAAALALDESTVTALLAQSLTDRGAAMTWNTAVRPVLRHVAGCDRAESYRIAAEHLLSHLVTTTFHAYLIRNLPVPARRPALLACASEEQHTLPLIALAATSSERRIPTATLGARTPAPALAAAVLVQRPFAVVVLALTEQTADVSMFPDELAASAGFIAAGPGWDPARLPPGIPHVDGLDPAVTLLQDHVPEADQ